jgi:DNA-directed RNA polymerase subunit RPC12/RpoP
MWRNWQTRRTQNPVALKAVWVRPPPSAPLNQSVELNQLTPEPKGKPMEYKFTCPRCSQPIIADDVSLGQAISCPDCGQEFIPRPLPPQPSAADVNAEQLRKLKIQEIENQREKDVVAAKLETKAGSYSRIAGVLLLIGIIALIFGFVFITQNGGVGAAVDCWSVSGASLGSALPIYLLAQVIHIRALLTRK